MIKRIGNAFRALRAAHTMVHSEALRDDMRAFAATQNMVAGGELEAADVRVGEVGLRLQGRAGGEMEISAPSSEIPLKGFVFPPTTDRPAAYPDDLPFLPSLRTSVTALPHMGRVVVSWPRPMNPRECMVQVRAQLLANGWSEEHIGRSLFGILGRRITYSRGEDSCRLHCHRIPGQPTRIRLVLNTENALPDPGPGSV